MIIERKYVSFYQLSKTDPKAREIFEGTIKKYIKEIEAANHLIEHHYSCRTMVYGAGMGYCIPHFDEIVDGFELLDSEFPYDNGLEITDANKVEIVKNTKGYDWDSDDGKDYIELHFIQRFHDEEYIIKAMKVYKE